MLVPGSGPTLCFGLQGGTTAQESAPAADQQVHLQRFQAATKAFVDLHVEVSGSKSVVYPSRAPVQYQNPARWRYVPLVFSLISPEESKHNLP